MTISSSRHLRRQKNLHLLVQQVGGVTAMALLTGTPKSHISALLAGKRGVGDELAAKFERKAEKEPGWMDVSHDDEPIDRAAAPEARDDITDRERELIAAYRYLPADEQEELYHHTMARAEKLREHVEQLLRDRFGVSGVADNTRVTEAIEKGSGLLVRPTAQLFDAEGQPPRPRGAYKLPDPIPYEPAAPTKHRKGGRK